MKPEVPKIIFIDEEVKSYCCEWLKANEKNVGEKVGTLLNQTGISGNEFCTLSKKRIVNDTCLIDCFLNMEREKTLLSVSQLENNIGILQIEYKRYSKLFDYMLEFEGKESSFKIHNISIINKQTGLKYCYDSTNTEYKASISDYNNIAFITLNYPESLEKHGNLPFIDINKINNKLIYSDIKFGVRDIYSMLKESSFEDISAYPMINIKITGKNPKNVINSTTFSYGDVSEIIKNKDGVAITINGENSWVYQSDGLTITKNDNLIEYKLVIGAGRITANAMPMEQIANAGLVVSDIKRLVKDIK